jgi:hypothetical protein
MLCPMAVESTIDTERFLAKQALRITATAPPLVPYRCSIVGLPTADHRLEWSLPDCLV